jgi:PKD repeat protein
LLISPLISLSQNCNLTFIAYDSYSDGWSGNEATITFDGLYPQTISLDDGASQEFPMNAFVGETIEISWVLGDFPEDVSFDIVDANGNSIYSGTYGDPVDETLNENCDFGGGGVDPVESSFNCVDNSCTEQADNNGDFQTLEECQQQCGVGPEPDICNYQITIVDSYSDGWNGGSVIVYSDGEEVFSNDGSSLDDIDNVQNSISDTYDIEFNNGAQITLSWTEGAYDDEVSIVFINANGIPVVTFLPAEMESLSFTVDCGNNNSGNNSPLSAGFTVDLFEVNIGNNVSFYDTSYGEPTSWNWNFGDGNSSSEQNPIHSYAAAGQFNVSLTVSNETGNDLYTFVDCITVNDPCVSGSEIILTNLAFTDGITESGTIWEEYYEFPTSISYNETNPLNLLDPGRFVRFKIQAYNNLTNGQNLVGASCEIFCDDDYAEITDATAGLNNVAWNESGWSTDEFEIYISPNAPPGHVINFDFRVTQFDNNWFTRCVKIPVRPIVISNMSIDDDANPDSDGNGNGIIEQDETVEVFPLAENVSTLSVPLLGGKFYSSSSCVEVWNGQPGSSGIVESSSWWNYQFNLPQPIEPGGNNLQPQFDFVFDYSCGENPFELSVLFSGGFELFNISNLPWELGLSNKKSLIRFSSPSGFNNWVEFGDTYDCINGDCLINNSGDGDYLSLTACQNVCVSSTSIDDQVSKFEVYPNPNNGVFNISFESPLKQNVTIEVFNMLGNVIYTKTLSNNIGSFNVELSDISSGVYFIKLDSNEKIFYKKISIQ